MTCGIDSERVTDSTGRGMYKRSGPVLKAKAIWAKMRLSGNKWKLVQDVNSLGLECRWIKTSAA